jgi:hypothetical protein
VASHLVFAQHLHDFVVGSKDRVKNRIVFIEGGILRQESDDFFVGDDDAPCVCLLCARDDT